MKPQKNIPPHLNLRAVGLAQGELNPTHHIVGHSMNPSSSRHQRTQ